VISIFSTIFTATSIELSPYVHVTKKLTVVLCWTQTTNGCIQSTFT
jgi:hypothetical protein